MENIKSSNLEELRKEFIDITGNQKISFNDVSKKTGIGLSQLYYFSYGTRGLGGEAALRLQAFINEFKDSNHAT